MIVRDVRRPFVWRPGEGYDAQALARIRRAFPRPAEPMGEAWFMGEKRRFFTELAGNLDDLVVGAFDGPLSEIAGGFSRFGAREEWRLWLHHLLGPLIPRSHEFYTDYLLERLISTFMSLYPLAVEPESYPGFRDDTLGRCMMDRACWSKGEIVLGTALHSFNPRTGLWRWFDASGDFSASMFFRLKFLRAEEIEPWLRSALAIACPHWRAQLLVWFVGAHEMLVGRTANPACFDLMDRPSVL